MAAALFAMLAVAVWGFGGKGQQIRSVSFWLCLGLSTFLAGFVVATASRGGMVALAAGLAGGWVVAGFPRVTSRRAVGIVLAVCVLLGFAAAGRMGERMADSSLEDGSITSRLAIFKVVPAMLAASPQGWGVGESAEAYQNWFQALDDTRNYKHLLSTHVTWMVERGWGFRFVYLLGWAAILMLCAKVPASFGVWIAFGVAGVFSHVGGDWRLWIVPGLALAWALANRARRKDWPPKRAWGYGLAIAAGLTLMLWIIGHQQGRKIFHTGWGVTVGRGEPETWFFSPDPAVLGSNYGKAVRPLKSAGVAWTIQPMIRAAPRKIVLSGRSPIPGDTAFAEPYDLVWLNPPAILNETQKHVVERAIEKTIVWGELRTDANPGKLKTWFSTLVGGRWIVARGKGLFVGSSGDW